MSCMKLFWNSDDVVGIISPVYAREMPDYINAVKMVDNYLPGFEAQEQIDTAGKKDIEG